MDNRKVSKSNNDYKKLAELRKKNFELTMNTMRELDISDQMLIQNVLMIDELTKTANRLTSRLRDWVAWPVPEARREVSDNLKLTELVSTMSKATLVNDIHSRAKLPEHFGTKDLNWDVIQAAAAQIKQLFDFKDYLESELDKMMEKTAPNMRAVCGSMIGAKLISIAGSLKRVAEFPSGTVQLLGAEKALFRHLKTGARCPKHGIIVQHPLLANAPRKERGRVARVFADKISIAAKVDYFKGSFIGDLLNERLDKVRFK